MSKNILLIDHSKAECLYYTSQFERLHHSLQFFYASTAREGLKILKRQKMDIVLIEKNLPGVNGLLLLAGIKYIRKFRDIKIFIYSASIDEGYSSLAKMLGASGCIEKKKNTHIAEQELKAILQPDLLPKYVFFRRREPTYLINFTSEFRETLPD